MDLFWRFVWTEVSDTLSTFESCLWNWAPKSISTLGQNGTLTPCELFCGVWRSCTQCVHFWIKIKPKFCQQFHNCFMNLWGISLWFSTQMNARVVLRTVLCECFLSTWRTNFHVDSRLIPTPLSARLSLSQYLGYEGVSFVDENFQV